MTLHCYSSNAVSQAYYNTSNLNFFTPLHSSRLEVVPQILIPQKDQFVRGLLLTVRVATENRHYQGYHCWPRL